MLPLAQSLGCRTDELADTSTIDGFQGWKSSVVILVLLHSPDAVAHSSLLVTEGPFAPKDITCKTTKIDLLSSGKPRADII